MRVLRDNVLVKKLEKSQLGNIIIPETIEDEWYRGKVIGVGKGVHALTGELIPPDVKVGDIVIFPPPMGTSYPAISADSEECLIIPEKFIYAVETE